MTAVRNVVRYWLSAPLTEWEQAGLRLPSIVRLDKLATIEKSLVERTLGPLTAADLAAIITTLRSLFSEIASGGRKSGEN